MKIAFLYAGQGSQFEGMGKDLYENQEIFAKTFDKLENFENIKKMCFEYDLASLSKTSNTQPCMVAFAVALTETLKSYGIIPEMTAGLSLGEYSALNCANVLGNSQAVKLVSFRGLEMEKASKGLDCKMIAIMNLSRELVQKACEDASEYGIVSIANYNHKDQLVIAGESEACTKASELALEFGAKRAIELNVSGPFHTKLMKSAGDALEKRFSEENFADMQIPVVFNTIGSEKNENQDIKDLLVAQVQSSVYFEDSIKYMIEKGVDTFVEIGGGKVLSGFVKKISKTVETYAVYDMKTLESVIEKLKGEI